MSGVFPTPSPSQTVAAALAQAGYVAIPLQRRGNQRAKPLVTVTVDTVETQLILDSGCNCDLALPASFDSVPGVQLLKNATSTTGTAYGLQTVRQGLVDRVMVGTLAVGPLDVSLRGTSRGPSAELALLGTGLLVSRAAVIDLATDTVYLLAADTVPPYGKRVATEQGRALRARLEAAGQYRTFLSLMRSAGLTRLLEATARDERPLDSLVWIKPRPQAYGRVDLDTTTEASQRLAVVRQVLDHEFRAAGQLTVFIPTDAAFARLAPAALQALRADTAKLVAFLRAHMLTGTRLKAASLRTLVRGAMQPAGPTLGFHPLGPSRIDVDRLKDPETGSVLARATIVEPDLMAVNGVAHGIDRLLVASAEPAPWTAALVQEGEYTAIPLQRRLSGHFAIQVKIDGKPLTLIVDTGAPGDVMMDHRLIRRLNLPLWNAALTLQTGQTIRVNIDPLDLSALATKAAETGDAVINGLLGAKVLMRYDARLDLGAGVLYLRLPASSASDTTAVP